MTAFHKVDEGQVVLRVNQKNVRSIAKDLPYGSLHIGVKVYWVDDLHITALCNSGQSVTNPFEPAAETLSAMTRNKNHPMLGVEERKLLAEFHLSCEIFVQPSGNLQ